jgi:hypothetical protein
MSRSSSNSASQSSALPSNLLPSLSSSSVEDAIRSARDEVASMFRSPSQLSRLPAFLHECERKKSGLEQTLSTAVRTQVDETRLGLQLLGEAAQMMQKMRSNFQQIDTYCKDCKSVLRDTPEIQRVNTARKNLDATTRLLDKFRSLPHQAEQLLDELDESDRAIKSVYKRMRVLFRLRDSAMDQSVVGANGASIPGGGGGFSADFLSQLQENFEGHSERQHRAICRDGLSLSWILTSCFFLPSFLFVRVAQVRRFCGRAHLGKYFRIDFAGTR